MSNHNVFIPCFVFFTFIFTPHTVEIISNINNEPHIELVNPNVNIFIGDESGRINTGHHNKFTGHQSTCNKVTGSEKYFLGITPVIPSPMETPIYSLGGILVQQYDRTEPCFFGLAERRLHL